MRQWLSDLRGNRSQDEIAQHAHLSQQGYSAIERGIITPSVPTAKRIAGVLGFEWERFYTEDDQGNTPEKAAL